MSGIAGLFGDLTGSWLTEMLKKLEHRGPDGSGIYVDGQLFHGETKNLSRREFKVALGQNSLSIAGSEVQQPLVDEERVLVANGRIYNYQELKQSSNYNFRTNIDWEVILSLLDEHGGQLFQAIPKVVERLDGDYAFVVFDGENWAAVRDPVGVKPLYYGAHQGMDLFGVASERKALWEIGIREVDSLNPGFMLCNRELIPLPPRIKKPAPLDPVDNSSHVWLKSKLKADLIRSVQKRIRGLDRVGVVFSGGVDSTILVQICLSLGVKPELYTVGRKGSPDIRFSHEAADIMGLTLYTAQVTEEEVRRCVPLVLEAIEEWNIMKLGVGMATFMAAEQAAENGLRVLLSGQGADELFGGYHRYLELCKEGPVALQNGLWQDLLQIYGVNLERDDAVAMAHSVELRVPYLDLQVINRAMDIPTHYKIRDQNDQLRKCILREVAAELSVPEFIVKRPKKAAQYGSGIHQLLVKKVFKDQRYVDKLKVG